MDYSLEDLKAMKVAELRDIARDIEHDALQGYSSMRKEELIEALLAAMGGAARPVTRAKKSRPASGSRKLAVRRIPTAGLDRPAVKELIRGLKAERAGALEAGDRARLRLIRRQMHRLKRIARVAPKPEPAAAAPQEEAAPAE